MTKAREELRLSGVPVSSGIAIGALYVLHRDEHWNVPEFSISKGQIEEEIARYRSALICSHQELEKLRNYLKEEGAKDAVCVIEAHMLMLTDPVVTSDVESKIALDLKNTESVFVKEMSAYMNALLRTEDVVVQQRVLDIKDLVARVVRHLHPSGAITDTNIPSHSIVCATDLVPSQTAEASPNQIRAFVTKYGGPTSHAALIAKAKGIPYISDVDLHLIEPHEEAIAIVDGFRGLVIIDPSEETIFEYERVHQGKQPKPGCEIEDSEGIDWTLDGKEIEVQANLEDLHELYLLKQLKTKTIGLIRSEFLYLKRDVESFCEIEQFELYKKLMQLAGNMEVTFRIFDIGSDKRFMKTESLEPNPALGCRSIRFLIHYPKVFSTQIRAALRAAKYGKMKLLLPLISDLEELRQAKAFIEMTKKQLRKEGVDFCNEIEIGCMVEVPAFVMMCDEIVKECDFLSIGTNDLVQYTFAADRSNPITCERYPQDHPAIVRMIRRVVQEAHRAGVPVSICGEMASDPNHTELLIGLGITKLSCAPRFIPSVKEAISKVDAEAAELKVHLNYPCQSLNELG